jgi:hypothetical protein
MFGGCINQPMNQMKKKKKNKQDPYMNMIKGQIMLERFQQAKAGKEKDKKSDPKPWYKSMTPWELGAILFLVGMIISPMFVVYMVSTFKHSMDTIQQLAR